METRHANSYYATGVSRRELLQAGLAAGVTWSTWPLHNPPVLWGEAVRPPRRGGILHGGSARAVEGRP